MGELVRFQPNPGVSQDGTRYSNMQTWYDCNLIRFRNGLPESMGGWQKVATETFFGSCRCLHEWSSLDGAVNTFLGTHLKCYVEIGSVFTDITPLRVDDASLGTDPFDTVDTSTTVTVNHNSHGAIVDDFVTFSGATATGGISADTLNANHQITSVAADGNSFTIEVSSAATSTTSGGGSSVTADYEINVGSDTFFYGAGWGAGKWTRGTWGSAADITIAGAAARIWSADNFGEDLIICARDGSIYYWDYSAGGRAVLLSTLSGASDVPTVATMVLTSDTDRHVIAFGSNVLGESDQDRLFIRWSDAEDAANWTPATDNSAGDLRISHGSEIITAYQTRQEILIWTNTSLISLSFLGPPYYFGLQTLATGVTIAGPKAKATIGDVVYWMGGKNFYSYDGRVNELICPLENKVFTEIDNDQLGLVYAGANENDGEIIWFYKSTSGSNNNKYIIYNTREKAWYFGDLTRTAWIDRGLIRNPRATGDDGYFYHHETGHVDGSTDPETALNSYIESGPFELGSGDRLVFCNRIIPDITFLGSTEGSPSVDFTIKVQDYPGDTLTADATGGDTVTRTATSPVEQFTEQLFVRMRGRMMSLRVENTVKGVSWQLGIPRFEVRPDGRR